MPTVLENWANIHFVCIPANGYMEGIRFFAGQPHLKNNSIALADSKRHAILLKSYCFEN